LEQFEFETPVLATVYHTARTWTICAEKRSSTRSTSRNKSVAQFYHFERVRTFCQSMGAKNKD